MHQTLKSVGLLFSESINVNCRIFYEWWNVILVGDFNCTILKDNDRSSHDKSIIDYIFFTQNLCYEPENIYLHKPNPFQI